MLKILEFRIQSIYPGLVSSLNGLLIGYLTSISAGLLIRLKDLFHLNMLTEGWLVSSVIFGGFLGSILSRWLSQHYGPKRAILIACMTVLLFTMIPLSVRPEETFIWSRFFSGIGLGILSMIVPVYIAEISPASIRGGMVSVFQLMITLGIVFAYVMIYLLKQYEAWQFLLWPIMIVNIMLICCVGFQPESPRWLMATGKISQAKALFYKINGIEWSHSDLEKIQQFSPYHGFYQTFKANQSLRKMLLLTISLFIFQNWSGIDAILYYAPVIFQRSGVLTQAGIFLDTLILGFINMLATLIAIVCIDSYGRKVLFKAGLIFMVMGLLIFILNLYVKFFGSYTPVAGLIFFVSGFAISLGPLPAVIMSELFPVQVRMACASICSSISWLSNAYVTLLFPSFLNTLGLYSSFMFFTVICILAYYTIHRYLPETRGHSLEYIESNFYS